MYSLLFCPIFSIHYVFFFLFFFFFKQKTAYEMRISDWSSDVCSSDLPARVSQRKLLELAIGQHTAPTVENHDGLRARPDLGIEILSGSLGIDGQHAVKKIRTAVKHGFYQAIVVASTAFDHVAANRPRAARKTYQGDFARQFLANKRQGVKHILQPGHIGYRQGRHVGLGTDRRSEPRAFAIDKIKPQAHGMRYRQNVGEQNRRVELEALDRLQGDLARVPGGLSETHKKPKKG